MKRWIFGVITVVCVSASSVALGCPVGGEEGIRPIRPVVQNVSLQASELIQRASRLESAASGRDADARTLEQEADMLMNRARVLRDQATFVNVSDRASLLDVADDLSVRASEGRMRAAEERARARSLRIEAQNLRRRAMLLVRDGRGGGWRGRNKKIPVASDRSVAL